MKKVIFGMLNVLCLVAFGIVAFAPLIYGLNLWGWWYLIPVIVTIILIEGWANLAYTLYFVFSVGLAAIASAYGGRSPD